MRLLIILLVFSNFVWGSSMFEGLSLIKQNKFADGYSHLENSYNLESNSELKAELAFILAFASKEYIKGSPAYYARYVLKYKQDLSSSDMGRLKLIVADSFMEIAEFNEAKRYYQEVIRLLPEEKDYITYQMGFYHLNNKSYDNAFKNWWSIGSPDTFKAIGRYWEKMNFPGNIFQLSSNPDFIAGFTRAVEEREKELSLKDLNQFRSQKASPEMLGVLIDRNPLFVKDPCGFVDWYQPEIKISNNIVFPYLQKCLSIDDKKLNKIISISESAAANVEEKTFLARLYHQKADELKACRISGGNVPLVIAYCKENTKELEQGVQIILNQQLVQYKHLLENEKVLMSLSSFDKNTVSRIRQVISEEAFVNGALSQEEVFLSSLESLSEDSLFKYILFHSRESSKIQLVSSRIQSAQGKLLLDYLKDKTPITASLCDFGSVIQKKLAAESKLNNDTIDRADFNCMGTVLEEDSNLLVLVLEKSINRAEKVQLVKEVSLVETYFETKNIVSIPESMMTKLSAEFAKDLELLLVTQDFKIRRNSSSEGLMQTLAQTRNIKLKLSKRTWHSKVLADKAIAFFNRHLIKLENENQSLVSKLKMDDAFKSYLSGMKFI